MRRELSTGPLENFLIHKNPGLLGDVCAHLSFIIHFHSNFEFRFAEHIFNFFGMERKEIYYLEHIRLHAVSF